MNPARERPPRPGGELVPDGGDDRDQFVGRPFVECRVEHARPASGRVVGRTVVRCDGVIEASEPVERAQVVTTLQRFETAEPDGSG